jgi:hypothetical protein
MFGKWPYPPAPHWWPIGLEHSRSQGIGRGAVMEAPKDSTPKDESPSESGKGSQEIAQNERGDSIHIGSLPVRHSTVTASVLCRLLEGENLTGMDAVFGCSTTRLAAVIYYLAQEYGWYANHVDIDVGTNDGRVATIRTYHLPRAVIRKAFDAGALEFCRSVKAARAATRKNAAKAKEEAHKRNAARRASRRDLFQGSLFGVGYE